MEISEAYRYCPICGEARQPSRQLRPFRCSKCTHTSFFGPVTAVGCVITNQAGRVLLIERAKDPGCGKLGMPGGFVDPNESAEFALRREIQEEVGIVVDSLTFLLTAPNNYVYQAVVYPVLDIFFHAKVSPNQTIQAEASEVASWLWTEITVEILDRMAFPSNRLALESYISTLDAK
jgi:NADH pyrophosphatase NudC (nudix superfamily)